MRASLNRRLLLAVAFWMALLGFGATTVDAHTKGITLSRFGLIDISMQGNVTYSQYTNYADGVDFTKIGDRNPAGFNITSFDLSLSGEFFQFPAKYALFLSGARDTTGFEEAFILFHKLPYNLQAKVGEFRANFTKLNQYHDHEWLFADPPLNYVKFLGVDGIHRTGLEVTYTPPLSTYVELSGTLMAGPFDADNILATRRDPVNAFAVDQSKLAKFFRASTFLPLSDDADLEIGLSYGDFFNKPQSSSRDKTKLFAFDSTFRWKPAERPIFPSLRWTTEYMIARRDNPCVRVLDRTLALANLPGIIDPACSDPLSPVTDLPGVNRFLRPSDTVGGVYSEIGYRFAYHWEVGGRIDIMGIPRGQEDPQTRYTLNLRYFMNPVAKLNFQIEHSVRSGISRPFDGVILQLNMGLGTVTPGLGKFFNLF